MSGISAASWTLEVLLEMGWERCRFSSSEAAMATLESVIDDYGDQVAMAHLISPDMNLKVVNLHALRSIRANLEKLRPEAISPH